MTDNTNLPSKTVSAFKEDPYKVTSQFLNNIDTQLTCFFFHQGANFYVFSYKSAGERRHTFIDTGDPMYRDRILSILKTHQINPDHIDAIIITHRHHDHCGLADILAEKSGAKILVHSNFRHFIEQSLGEDNQSSLRGFDPSRLQKCKVDFLSPSKENPSVRIDNIHFPCLTDALQIGDTGHLEILACPESPMMHSPDQLMVRYIPKKQTAGTKNTHGNTLPADHILFSGDLWLMHGPLFTHNFRHLSRNIRLAYNRMKGAIRGEGPPRRDPRLQDTQAKEALKRGFSLIQVMPGHGEDFLGTRMIPGCFLADRDIIVELGYDMLEKKSILRSGDLMDRVATLREKAFATFTKEVDLWQKFGYTINEISEFLVRIYEEQNGGGPLVKEDRKERRQQIEETLCRLRDSQNKNNSLKMLAESTLLKFERIS